MDKNSMFMWYPKIAKLDIPQPKTVFRMIPDERLIDFLNQEAWYRADDLQDIYKAMVSLGQPEKPVFIRTDLASAKHSWTNTCFIPAYSTIKDIEIHIARLYEENLMRDLMFIGLVIREYIPMATRFCAFWGNLPINPERRYFIRDGQKCHHPYWIEGAIDEWVVSIESHALPHHIPASWKEILAEMNTESDKEIALLTRYAEMVAGVLDGYWSVDFCLGADNKWYLIDCALGTASWHPEH